MSKKVMGEIMEKELNAPNGLAAAFLTIFLYIAAIAGIIPAGINLDSGNPTFGIPLMVICLIWLSVGWIPLMGIKVIRPNEALVLTLFGKYTGTLKKDGIFFVNPFSTAVNPARDAELSSKTGVSVSANGQAEIKSASTVSKKLSLKAMTLNNQKQKINDKDGNPVEVSIVVIWKIANTAKNIFFIIFPPLKNKMSS